MLTLLLLVAVAVAAVMLALESRGAPPAPRRQNEEVARASPSSTVVAHSAPTAPRAAASARSSIPLPTEQASRRLQVRVTRCPQHLREHYELSACLRRPGPRAAGARQHVLHDGATVLVVARELGGWVEIQATHRATGWSTQIARPFVEPGQDSIEIDLAAQRAGVRAHNVRAQLEVPADLDGTFTLTLVPSRFADAGTGPSVSFTPERGHAEVWVHGLLAGSYIPFVEGGAGALRCELAPLRVQGDTAVRLALPAERSVVVAREGVEEGSGWLQVRRPNGARCAHAQRRRAGGVIELRGLGSGAVLLWATGPRLVSRRIALELRVGQPSSVALKLGRICRLDLRCAGPERATGLRIRELDSGADVVLTEREIAELGRTRRLELPVWPGRYAIAMRFGERDLQRVVQVEGARTHVTWP